jgi:hypothetical protein
MDSYDWSDGAAEYVIFTILLIVPTFKILKKTGMNPAWSFLHVIPLFGWLAVLFLLSFGRWPAVDDLADKG